MTFVGAFLGCPAPCFPSVFRPSSSLERLPGPMVSTARNTPSPKRTWGQRWLARAQANEDLDLEPVLVDMQRRVRFAALPKAPFVVRFEVRGHQPNFMLLKKTEASLCHQNPGFPELVCLRGPLAALVAWWRGDVSFVSAQRMGLAIDGPKAFARAFPKWFDLYPFAHIGPAGQKAA